MTNKVDAIKALHFLGFLSTSPLSHAASLVSAHRQLTPEQRAHLRRHVASLRAYLEQRGQVYTDDLLLELACLGLVPGHRRDSLGIPARLGRDHKWILSEAELRQAAGWLERLSGAITGYRSLSVQECRNLLRYAADVEDAEVGAPDSDTVQILSTLGRLVSPPPRDLWVRLLPLYHELSAQEGQELARYALRLLDAGYSSAEDIAEDMLMCLACCVLGALEGLHAELVERRVYYPGILYLGADARTRDKLIELVDVDSRNSNHLLVALAWIGDESVQGLFQRWRQAAPEWASSLHVPPADYSLEAGWRLTASGERRDLFHWECYRLRPTDGGSELWTGPVNVLIAHEDRCGWCGRQLTTLFEFDLGDPQLSFLQLAGDRLRIAMCERCTSYATVFTEIDFSGASRWSRLNVKPEYLGRDDDEYTIEPQRQLILGTRRRSPFEATAHILTAGQEVSQIGGYPAWVQDAEYSICPGCEQPMSFLGQLHLSEVQDYVEGTVYAFLCPSCQLAATNYQQT